jgi:hypothetical protein
LDPVSSLEVRHGDMEGLRAAAFADQRGRVAAFFDL